MHPAVRQEHGLVCEPITCSDKRIVGRESRIEIFEIKVLADDVPAVAQS